MAWRPLPEERPRPAIVPSRSLSGIAGRKEMRWCLSSLDMCSCLPCVASRTAAEALAGARDARHLAGGASSTPLLERSDDWTDAASRSPGPSLLAVGWRSGKTLVGRLQRTPVLSKSIIAWMCGYCARAWCRTTRNATLTDRRSGRPRPSAKWSPRRPATTLKKWVCDPWPTPS